MEYLNTGLKIAHSNVWHSIELIHVTMIKYTINILNYTYQKIYTGAKLVTHNKIII